MPICFTQPIRNVRDCLYMALPPRRCWSLHPQGLSLGTFNTRNGRGFRLAYEIRAVQISSFDLIIMTETKITDQAYLCNMMVYDVMFLEDITMKGGGVQGGSGPGHMGTNPGLEHRVDTIPRAKHGDLQGRCRRQTDPSHWRITSSLHPGALTRPGGGPGILTGQEYYSVRRPQHQHWPRLEPLQSSGCLYTDEVRDGGPPSSLQAMHTIPPPEDVLAGAKGKIVAGKM